MITGINCDKFNFIRGILVKEFRRIYQLKCNFIRKIIRKIFSLEIVIEIQWREKSERIPSEKTVKH